MAPLKLSMVVQLLDHHRHFPPFFAYGVPLNGPPSAPKLPQDELHGAVVGAGDFVVDGGGEDAVAEGGGDDEVVDAPPGVVGAGVEAVGPPGVLDLAGVLEAPGVDEAGAEQGAELRALLVGETGVAAVRGGGFQVDPRAQRSGRRRRRPASGGR